MTKRIVMYWHNGRSLGHTAETAKIAHALVRGMPALALSGLTGAFRGLDLLPEQMDVVKLPAFTNYDRASGWETAGRQGLDRAALFRARADLCETYLRHLAPEITLVNHLPRGAEDELVPALSSARSGLRVLTLRGVLFDRRKTGREYFDVEPSTWIEKHFDAIFVHIDPEIFDLDEAYDIPSQLRSRLRYTGYLAEPLPLSRAELRRKIGVEEHERLVVASMGGGQGTLPIWREVVSALAANRDSIDKAYLIGGPYLEAEDAAELAAATAGLSWLRLAAYEPNQVAWMTAADLLIGAAGSNMLGETLANRCNAIVVPRQIREPEQKIHAAALAKRGLVRACPLEEVLSGCLSRLVAQALREPLRSNGGLRMDGANRYASYLAELTGGGAQ